MIANSLVRNAWYSTGLSGEFETGKVYGQVIAVKPIVLWRTEDGTVVAFDDRCVHKRMPLSEGRIVGDGSIECPYHGLCYDASGACIRIPSLPDGPIPTRAKLKPHPVKEQGGLVWVWIGDPTESKACDPPDTPEIAATDWTTVGSGEVHIKANYQLLIENLLDITHFYPLHDGNIGDIANSRIPVIFETKTINGNKTIKSIRYVENYEQPAMLADWFGYPVVDRNHTHHMMNAGLTRVENRVAPPGQLQTEQERGYVLYHTHTPIDRTNLIWRWFVSTPTKHKYNGDKSKTIAERFAETFKEVGAQDHWALEKQQQMFAFDEGDYKEVPLETDQAVMKIRRLFSALEAAETSPARE